MSRRPFSTVLTVFCDQSTTAPKSSWESPIDVRSTLRAPPTSSAPSARRHSGESHSHEAPALGIDAAPVVCGFADVSQAESRILAAPERCHFLRAIVIPARIAVGRMRQLIAGTGVYTDVD
ncbi:hypothetical protein GCM10023405_31590 [Streptomonospora salina]